MRLWGIVCAFWFLLPLGAWNIIDGTTDGSAVWSRQVLALALENKWKLSLKRAGAAQALSDFKAGKADAVVLDEKDVPTDLVCKKQTVFRLAAAVYVNGNNTCTGLSRQELENLLASPRPTWKSITGNAEDIHLYGLKKRAEGYGLFCRLALKPDFEIKSPIFRTISTGNVIKLCGADPVSMGFALLVPVEDEMVRPLAIDGVEPSPENLKSGKYPLVVTHVLLSHAGADSLPFLSSAVSNCP